MRPLVVASFIACLIAAACPARTAGADERREEKRREAAAGKEKKRKEQPAKQRAPKSKTSNGDGADMVGQQKQIAWETKRKMIADLERKLADEVKRHEGALAKLRRDEQAAAGNPARLAGVRKAIEAEVASHQRRKAGLEQQLAALTDRPKAQPAK